ncbi:hypothetical protein [Brachybacterium alimentarium]|uniref:hypothetical protein n=1 Tax=Brachybacterium alimentarium TaxID=47845 RepID=UPI000DF3641E|nr:hypothetical protein [Brachybacterium alimentarium]RCS71638.1 hypothetical protein CIK68_09170 [Brachybacterium alimentarium]
MTPTTIITPLFRTGVLLQLAGTAAAHEEDISTKVLAEIASAVDAVNRAVAQLMADQDLQPEDLQPLLDAITAELSGGDPE